MSDQLLVYSLPISGEKFVTQLGLLCEIYDAFKHNGWRYQPDMYRNSYDLHPENCSE